MSKAKSLRVVLYLRRSDKKQEASVKDQRTTCLAYATKHGYVIVGEFVDDGISGDDTKKRAAFLDMRAQVGSGDFDAVLCWDQDRFGRFDSLEAGHWIYPFREAGVKLITIGDGPINWDDFAGRTMYTLKQEAKHQFLQDLSRNVMRGQVEAGKKGSWVGYVPFGYVITGTNKQKRLELGDPRKIAIVERIFKEYVKDGRTMRDIARRLNADKMVSPRGSQWRSDTIGVMLSNPAYMGTYRFNVSSRGKYHTYTNGEIRKGGSTRKKPESDWIEIPEIIPVIIHERTWKKAQAILAKGKTGRSPYKPDDNPFLFTGKLRCSKCGAVMHGLTRGNHRYYECGRQKVIQRLVGDGRTVKESDTCPGTTVREDHVLEWLGDYLADELSFGGEVDLKEMTKIAKAGKVTESELPQAFAKLKRMFVKDTAPKSDVKRTEKRIAAINADLAKAKRNLVLVDPKHIGEIEKAIEEYEQERLALVEQLKDQPKAEDVNDTLLGVLHSLILLWRRDPASVKAAMRGVESITCRTVRRGEGRATRHALKQVEFEFVGGVKSKTNHPRPHVKRAS